MMAQRRAFTTRTFRLPLALERLEDRNLLSTTPADVIASFRGTLLTDGTAQSSISMQSPTDFQLSGGRTLLGIQVKADGGALNPAAAQVRQGSTTVTPLTSVANLPGSTDSLTLVDLAPGNYSLSFSGEGGTSGAYLAEVYLAGDADGNHVINNADGTAISGIYGLTPASPRFVVAADTNRDNRIDAFDVAQWRRNLADGTQVRLLSADVTLAPAPVSLPDGLLLTNVAASSISGTVTSSRVRVDLETGPDDNFDNGTATAGAGGAFSIPVGLVEGNQTLRLRLTDGFGQQVIVTQAAALDTVAPNAGPGSAAFADGSTPVTFFDVVFSEAMGASAFAAANYAVTVTSGPGTGATIPVASVERLDGQRARLHFAAPLADGQTYRVALAHAITDLARNPLTAPLTLSYNVAESFRITSITPADGEEMVSLVREVVVNFSEPASLTGVDADAVQVLNLGQVVPGRLIVSSTGRFATFFPNTPWPASSELRVQVDGSKVRARDGDALDGDGDGFEGGLVTSDFRTLPITRIPGTNVFGYVFDSYDPTKPIAGATIRVDAFPEANAVTDATGFFELRDMPAPAFFVHIDGTTALNAPAGAAYPSVGKEFHSVPGQRIQINMAGTPFNIHLPPMFASDVEALSETESVDVGFGPAGMTQLATMFPNVAPAVWERLAVTFAPKAAVDDFGNAAMEATIIPVPPNRLPAPLPPGQNPQLVISIQALGATSFDIPAPITFPNLEGLTPGEKSLIWSFNHAAGRWEVIGTGTVSADGLSIVSDPGVGIRAPGWHYNQPGSEEDGMGEEEEEEEEESNTFEVGVSFDGNFIPIQFGVNFGFTLPASIFDPLVQDPQPLVWSPSLEIPEDGIDFDKAFTARFTVPDFAAPFIPEFDISLFSLEASLRVVGQAIAQITVEGDGFNAIGRISGEVGANVALQGSVGIADSFLCNIPYGIGNFICQEFSFAVPLLGPPTFEFEDVPIALPRTPVIDFSETVGPIAEIFAGTEISISPRVFVRRVSPGSGGQLAALSGQSPSQFQAQSVSLSTAPGFGNDPRMYYRYELANGLEVAGRTNAAGVFSTVLAPNTDFNLFIYSPSTNHWQALTGRTGPSGTTAIRNLVTEQWGGPDVDGDGLPDVGELVIGTALELGDTDNDGISDAAELEQGLDPLDGRSFPTGTISSLPLPGSAEKVAVEGNRIFVATGGHGLAVVDGTQFNNPILLGQIDLSGTATGVGVDAGLNLAAVATGAALQIVDVSDGMAPRLARSVAIPATHVEVANGLAYAASGNTLRVIDLVSGSIRQTLTLPGSGTLTGFAREGTKLYAFVSGSDTFSVIDIANEGAAVVRGQRVVSIASFDVGLFVGNGVAWLSGSGLRTLDVSNPANPQIIQTPTGSQFFTARRIALNGSGLGLLLPDGGNFLQVYDTSNPSNVANLLLQLPLSGNARDVAISRGVAYVADGGRLEVVNYLPFDSRRLAPAVTLSTSAADQDPNVPGLQVFEGTTLPLTVAVSDDVQVRNVELLLNGTAVRNDVSFPSDFFAVAPAIAPGSTSFTLQVRATDTGGNVALSNVLTINLVEDTFAPTVTSFEPPTDTSRPELLTVVQVRFSEPMATNTVTSQTVLVRDAAGNAIAPLNFQLRDDDRFVQLTYAPLPTGSYQIVVRGGVTDRAGNALGAADVVSPFTLTSRATLSTTAADVDLAAPGVQVFESSTVPLTVTVVAGVAVQNVEFLFNGQVVGSDATSPYQFTVVAPLITPGADSFSVEARIQDTSGFTSLTNALVIGLRDDVTPPTVTGSTPAHGSLTSAGLTSFQVTFSEPIAAATVTTASFNLFRSGADNLFGTADDVAVPILSVHTTTGDTVVQLTTASLAVGSYQFRIVLGSITDRAGNALLTPFLSTFSARSDLIAFYSFDQGAVDASINGNNGTISGATPTSGYLGQGYQFDGINDFIRVPVNINPSVRPQLTMGAWVKADSANPIRQIISHDNAGFDRSVGIDFRGGGTGWSAFAGSGAVLGFKPVLLGQWTFVAVVYNQTASTVNLYVDGQVLQKSGSLGGGNTFTRIGSNPGFGEFFHGAIDSVFFISGALSPSELATLQSLGSPSGQSQFLHAGVPTIPVSGTAIQLEEQLRPVVHPTVTDLAATAKKIWQDALDVEQLPRFVVVANLPGGVLGLADPSTGRITLDDDGAGLGWYVGTAEPTETTGHYDLLTVLLHEMGHLLGFAEDHAHVDAAEHPADLMNDTLQPGVRKLPSALDLALLRHGPAASHEDDARRVDAVFGEPVAAWEVPVL